MFSFSRRGILLATVVIAAVFFVGYAAASDTKDDRDLDAVVAVDATSGISTAVVTATNRKMLSLESYTTDILPHSRSLTCKGKRHCDDDDDDDDNDDDDDDHDDDDDDDDDDDKKYYRYRHHRKSWFHKFYRRFFRRYFRKSNRYYYRG